MSRFNGLTTENGWLKQKEMSVNAAETKDDGWLNDGNRSICSLRTGVIIQRTDSGGGKKGALVCEKHSG